MSDTDLPRIAKTGAAIADQIRRQIATGDLPIGQHLMSEEELTGLYGIARTTLREALRILESQGLIEIRRGRGGGPVVTMPRIDSLAEGLAVSLQLRGTTIGDLDEARALIEPQLAGQLAAHHTADDLEALNAAVAEAAEAADSGDRRRVGLAALNMHETVMERAGNTTLATFSRLMHELVRSYYLTAGSHSDIETAQRAARSYSRLVRYIEAGDVDGATQHWRKQMAYTSTNLLSDQPLNLFPETE